MNPETKLEELKRKAACEAVKHVKNGFVVGLGSGSTAALAIETLGEKIKREHLNVLAVPTSYQAFLLAAKHGIAVTTLEEHGIILDNLAQEVGREYGDFDLICHVAYDQPPLTRKERAEKVKKRDYFTKYGKQARAVLDALLDKYADEGLSSIENVKILQLKPFSDIGTPMEIIKEVFGGKTEYENAVQELEQELFRMEKSA